MNILKFNTMKKITTLVASLFLAIATFAQVPQGFSYQAVVRDAQNAIVANQTVEVTLTITAELNGLAVQTYTEKHNAKTNQNGLFTLVVGQGESSQKFADFKWNVPQTIYNMKTETEYGTATTQLLSVPFALYAAQAGELDYAQLAKLLSSNDIQNLLDYVKTADIDNIYKYIEDSIRQNKFYFQNYVTKEVFENYVLSGGNAESVDLTVYAKKTDIPSLSDYALKSEIPTMPAVPTKVSELQNDANYLTEHQDITGKQDVITDLADIRSGAALGATALQSHQSLEAYAKTADLATVATSGDYNDLTNKPNLATKAELESLQNAVKATNSLFASEIGLTDNSLVDLGLSSGNLWATCNVGASSPEQDGGYYAWGETSTKDNYSWDTYQYGSSATTLTKYCTKAANGNNGFTDALNTLEVGDDAAAANLGTGWTVPTNSEWQELYDQCYWEQTADYNGTGVAGFIVYKSVDKTLDKQQTKGSDHVYTLAAAHIFLPFAGSVNGSAFQFRQVNPYWASTIVSDEPNNNPQNAHCIRICVNGDVAISSKTYPTYAWGRNAGCPVRPIRHADATVLPKKTSQLTADKIGDMPMATVNVVITNVDNVATVSFLGKELTSGTTTFKIPAYSPVFLSVVLSQYQREHENPERYYGYSYSYTVKINGVDFDPVAGYYYSAIPTGYKKAGNGKYESKGYLEYDKNHFFDYPTDWSNEEEVKFYMSEYIPRIEFLYEKTPVYKSGSGKVPENRYEPATPTDAERNMVNQVVGPFPNATNTIEIVVTRGGGGEIHN